MFTIVDPSFLLHEHQNISEVSNTKLEDTVKYKDLQQERVEINDKKDVTAADVTEKSEENSVLRSLLRKHLMMRLSSLILSLWSSRKWKSLWWKIKKKEELEKTEATGEFMGKGT